MALSSAKAPGVNCVATKITTSTERAKARGTLRRTCFTSCFASLRKHHVDSTAPYCSHKVHREDCWGRSSRSVQADHQKGTQVYTNKGCEHIIYPSTPTPTSIELQIVPRRARPGCAQERCQTSTGPLVGPQPTGFQWHMSHDAVN